MPKRWTYQYREGYYDGIYRRGKNPGKRLSRKKWREYSQGYKRGKNKRARLEKSGQWDKSMSRRKGRFGRG